MNGKFKFSEWCQANFDACRHIFLLSLVEMEFPVSRIELLPFALSFFAKVKCHVWHHCNSSNVRGGVKHDVEIEWAKNNKKPYRSKSFQKVCLKDCDEAVTNMFWHPTLSDRSQESGVTAPSHNRNKHLSLSQQGQLLPIFRFRRHILYALETHKTLVVVSETGTGKSTQIVQYLYHAGWAAGGRCIVCTQPRRIAAISLSARVAEEMNVKVGDKVGYSIRFENKTSASTAIKFSTDGSLLRETMDDPLLSRYSVIIIDEAHERSLHTDVLLGLLKKIKRKRPDLRIVVSSATIDAAEIKMFFETKATGAIETTTESDACIIQLQGRQHEVDILYSKSPVRSYIEAAVETVLKVHVSEGWGDILVFLPGAEEIDSAVHMLEERYDKSDMYFLPLYSSLPFHLQMKIFEPTPPGQRKVVVATNIAETSLTIEGIKFVIDSCFVKLNYFSPHTGVDFLVTCPISRASARQRAGRAGRTEPGKCFRLLTEQDFDRLRDQTPPEMQRADICSAVLQLKALGVHDVLHFDFLSAPPAESMIYALELLYSLGALDEEGRLTTMGEAMATMSVDPRMAKALLASWDFGCGEEVLTLAAMSSVEHPFIQQRARASQESKQRLADCVKEFAAKEGDHITLLNIYRGFEQSGFNASWCDSNCLMPKIMQRAREIRKNLRAMLRERLPSEGSVLASCGEDYRAVRRCMVSGYFANAASLTADGKYRTIRGQVSVTVHPTSILGKYSMMPEWVIFNDIVQSSVPQIRDISAIEPLWLIELAKHYYDVKNIPV